MGQEVQMDEHEGGVRPSVLHSLAQPLYSPRSWQGRRVPVHCVTDGNLRLSPGLPSYWQDHCEHELLFKLLLLLLYLISGGSPVR